MMMMTEAGRGNGIEQRANESGLDDRILKEHHRNKGCVDVCLRVT